LVKGDVGQGRRWSRLTLVKGDVVRCNENVKAGYLVGCDFTVFRVAG
jgi:hypothetical protein